MSAYEKTYYDYKRMKYEKYYQKSLTNQSKCVIINHNQKQEKR